MKKILLAALFITAFGQLHAETFTAEGRGYFWQLRLKVLNDEGKYQARLYQGHKTIKATVTREAHKDYYLYQGKSDDGKNFSVMTIEKPCTDRNNGTIWSHVVIANHFEHCSGEQIANPGSCGKEDADNHFEGCGGERISASEGKSTATTAANREKAKQLNTRGYRLYKKGIKQNNWDFVVQAMGLFYSATKADSSYALAPYNLACSLVIIGGGEDSVAIIGGGEDVDEIRYPDTIFTALQKAVALDPARLARSQTDPDLEEVRQSYRYYRDILGYSPKNDSQLKIMLQHIDWPVPEGPRLYHSEPLIRLVFRENGQVQIKRATAIEGKIPKGSPPWRHSYKNGRYRVANGVITVTFDGKSVSGELSEHGALIFPEAREKGVLPANVYFFEWIKCAA